MNLFHKLRVWCAQNVRAYLSKHEVRNIEINGYTSRGSNSVITFTYLLKGGQLLMIEYTPLGGQELKKYDCFLVGWCDGAG